MKAIEWWDRQSPIQAIALVLGVFVAAGAIAAVGRVPETTPATSYIYVLTTPVPTVPLPTADTRELEALRARVAELEAQNIHNNIMNVEPQPVYQTFSAPQATPYIADPQMTYSAAGSTVQIEVPTDAPRLCTGFGDWRDYDAMYQSSPACHQATP